MEKKGGLPAAGGATYVELWRRLIIQNIQLYLPKKLTQARHCPHGRTPTIRVPQNFIRAGLGDVIDSQKSEPLFRSNRISIARYRYLICTIDEHRTHHLSVYLLVAGVNRFPASSSRVIEIEQVPKKSVVTYLLRSSREPIFVEPANSVATGERVAVAAHSLSIDPVPKGTIYHDR